MGAYVDAVLVSIIHIPTYTYMYVEAVLVSCTARPTSLAVFEGARQTYSGM